MGDMLLFPFRLLVFLVRIPIGLLDVLVFLFYAIVLYVVALPAFLLNALIQLVAIPFLLARGENATPDFRARWFLRGPLEMFLRKERGITRWVRASWKTFESRKTRDKNRRRAKTRFRSHFQREEPVLSVEQPVLRDEPESLVLEDRISDIPVFGEGHRWPCKGNDPAGYVLLVCPHCDQDEIDPGRGYPVVNPGAAVFQFTADPGDRYTGGDECGVLHCGHCGKASYMVEVLEDKGVFNFTTGKWEPVPKLQASPVRELSIDKE